MTANHADDQGDLIPKGWIIGFFGLLAGAWLLGSAGCGGDLEPADVGGPEAGEAAPPDEAAETFPVTIRKPQREAALDIGVTGPDGKPQLVACATCHKAKTPNPEARSDNPPKGFHQTLAHAHGELSCVSCHNPADHYSSLRLADGTALPFSEVMQLCAQCHGPQYRDYMNGSHGGMTGHWDLTRGPRERLNCVDCHNPHSPKYPTVSPAPGSRERFKPATEDHDDHE